MRKEDRNTHPAAVKRRVNTLGGTVVAAGGCLLAIWHPDLALYGLVAALIGAGMVDPKELFGFLRK